MVGAAAGLALRGRMPVVHALATFLTMRAFEFIRTDVGIPGLPVKLVGFVPGVLSEANGPTHQAIEDVALMRAIPGMQVFCPADVAELRARRCRRIVASPAPWPTSATPRPGRRSTRTRRSRSGRRRCSAARARASRSSTYGPLLREARARARRPSARAGCRSAS